MLDLSSIMPNKTADDAYDMFCVDFMAMDARTRLTHLHSMSHSAREKGRIWRLVLETRDYRGAGDVWSVSSYNVDESAVNMVDEVEIRTQGKRFRVKSKSGPTGFVGGVVGAAPSPAPAPAADEAPGPAYAPTVARRKVIDL